MARRLPLKTTIKPAAGPKDVIRVDAVSRLTLVFRRTQFHRAPLR